MLLPILSTVDLEENEKVLFEDIYYHYRNLLFTYAKNIVNNPYDAEDVLQNAFIKIAKNIKKINSVNSNETKSFLIVITKNTAYDFLKQPYHSYEKPLDEIENTANLDDSIENLVEKLEYEDIVSVIKQISYPYREVLYFHYVKDYSLKQTAELLERKTETVKMQLVRGKKILISKLSEVAQWLTLILF